MGIVLAFDESISAAACATGLCWFRISGTFAVLDCLNLHVVWLMKRRRVAGQARLALPLVFVLIRMSAHVTLTGAFLWFVILCTV
jgi:Na+/phosphate symporter